MLRAFSRKIYYYSGSCYDVKDVKRVKENQIFDEYYLKECKVRPRNHKITRGVHRVYYVMDGYTGPLRL